MGLNTKAWVAQDQLLTLFRAQPGLSAWAIDYGIPASRPDDLHLFIDENVTDWSQQVATTGVTSKEESFRLAVFLYARRTDSTAQEVRDEISDAAGIVADIVGSTPFLGGTVLYAHIASVEYEGAFADPEGRAREGVLKLTIECTAFLTSA